MTHTIAYPTEFTTFHKEIQNKETNFAIVRSESEKHQQAISHKRRIDYLSYIKILKKEKKRIKEI
jgi:hypothetical protein